MSGPVGAGHEYYRDGTRVMLKTPHGPVCIAMAADTQWATILVTRMRKLVAAKAPIRVPV